MTPRDRSYRRPPRLIVRTLAATFSAIAFVLVVVFVMLVARARDESSRVAADNLEAGRRVAAVLEQRRAAELAAALRDAQEIGPLGEHVAYLALTHSADEQRAIRDYITTAAHELADRTRPDGLAVVDAHSSTCAVTYTETLTSGGDAHLQAGGNGYATTLVDLGAVTVNGPQASIGLYGQNIQTGALTATGGPHDYLRSSSGTIGGQPHAFSDDFTGGGADIKVATGTGTTSITIAGGVSHSGPGFGGVLLAADTIAVGNVATNTTGGLYIRSGQPANPVFGEEGPFGQQVGVLPAIDTGTITGGYALIEIGDQGSCSACSVGNNSVSALRRALFRPLTGPSPEHVLVLGRLVEPL